MNAQRHLQRLVLAAARSPAITVALLALLALGGVLVARSLPPSVADGTLVPSSSADYRATASDARSFGADPVVVIVREPLGELIATHDLVTVSELEACLAGQVLVPDDQLQALAPAPAGALPAYGGARGPCAVLMREHPAHVVYGPGTFLNHAVAAVNEQLTALRRTDQAAVLAASRRAYALGLRDGLSVALARSAASTAGTLESERLAAALEQLALRAGIGSLPSITSQAFLSQLVFTESHGRTEPRAQLALPVPDRRRRADRRAAAGRSRSAQVQRAITEIRSAVAMKRFRLAHGAGYTVTGEPVLVDDLAAQVTGQVPPLLLGALVVMALTLALAFGGSMRLAPLAIALAAAAITFGIAALARGDVDDGVGRGAADPDRACRRLRDPVPVPCTRITARRRGGRRGRSQAARTAPAIVTAALATAAGFARAPALAGADGPGLRAAARVGIVVALACTLTGGPAAIALGAADCGLVGASVRGAGEILRSCGIAPRFHWRFAARTSGGQQPNASGSRARRMRARDSGPPPCAGRALRPPRERPWAPRAAGGFLALRAARHPGRVVALGRSCSRVAGWVADARTPVQSDITKLVPSNDRGAAQPPRARSACRGAPDEIDVLVRARNVATPATIAWMRRYEREVLAHHGYRAGGGCATATLCPGLSLPDLFPAASGGTRGGAPSRASIDALLAACRRTSPEPSSPATAATRCSSFGIRLMALSSQQRVIDEMRARLHPPAGVSAQLAGLPVLAATRTRRCPRPAGGC